MLVVVSSNVTSTYLRIYFGFQSILNTKIRSLLDLRYMQALSCRLSPKLQTFQGHMYQVESKTSQVMKVF